ncbi:MAG: type II toxin-antitoxin system prevent-host-death family antitoxin [Luteitalea sp.]|nr:type II toxin-antitoxin system prevent-host-death family antitoxin [Luteitalea sp.]
MKSVNIAKLKNHLSAYLNDVKAGEEILVRDRQVPVARIVPFRADHYETERLRLAAEGKLRLGSGAPLGASFWKMPGPRLAIDDIRRVIDEDRRG